jgi:hypothetical protein
MNKYHRLWQNSLLKVKAPTLIITTNATFGAGENKPIHVNATALIISTNETFAVGENKKRARS